MKNLSQLLDDMLFDASALPNRPINRKLKNGLHVSMYNDNKVITLTISREKVYPSLVEWRTILRHWPWRVNNCEEPDRTMVNFRFCLRARIKKVVEVKQMSLLVEQGEEAEG